MKPTEMTTTRGRDQFYPTPRALADKMLENLDMKHVHTVLEPSAGKGDLVAAIARKSRSAYRHRDLDVDCCEIDTYLRQILKYNFSSERLLAEFGDNRWCEDAEVIENTKLHIVHDDFLTYATWKDYDLVLMNPPFSDGDKHLLKALEMQKDGGLIICLLNAETIRNPYTNTRMALAEKLKSLNAQIEFVEDAFSDAERTARADVAIVRVHIPEAKYESTIWERMEKAQAEEETAPDPEIQALVAGDYIEQAIRLYKTEVSATMELVKTYRAMIPYMQRSFSKDDTYRKDPILTLSVRGSSDGFNQREYMKAVRLKYWRELFSNEKFIGRLTSTLREKYEKQIEKMADYEFSAFNIKQVMVEMNADMTQGVEDEIMKLFEKLTYEHSWYPECSQNRHYYNGWATNKAHKIGKKCIIPEDMFHDSWGYGKDYMDTYKAFRVLSDLEKAFDYLGGKGPEGYSLEARLEWAKQGAKTRNIDLKYFSIDIYKKGTTHIKFYPETMELVERMNIYASQKKGWLPPRYGKAKYADMRPEEKAVVDSFHGDGADGSGEKAYAAVMAKADFYLTDPAQKLPALMAPAT